MTHTRTLKIETAIFVVAVICSFIILNEVKSANAEAPFGLHATVASSSQLTVGPGNNVWSGFGTTTNEGTQICAARIISTVGQPIMISFASLSSTTLSQTSGYIQAASTTVAYDGGLYGCGYMTIRGLIASTTINVAQTY